MKVKNPIVDAVSVTRNTDMAKYISDEGVRHALEFMTDPRKKKRLENCECKTCFYFRSGRIGGAAMTSANCGACNKDIMYSSTNVDQVCKPCGIKHELCVRCGGDVHMRPRRIFKPDA